MLYFLDAVAPNSLLDKGIAIAIMLFILSMISERFVTWLRLYFGKEGKHLWGFSNADEDLTIKTNDPEFETRKERKILGLNITIGILVAIVSHANFFAIMHASPDPYDALGWSTIHFEISLDFIEHLFAFLFGCILTGFFISLGSKFWHDLLDMLFYAKNLKAKLADPNTYESEDIHQLDEYISTPTGDIIQMAIDQNKNVFAKPNIVGAMHGKFKKNGKLVDCISVHVNDSNNTGYPTQVPVTLPSGRKLMVDIDYILNVGMPKAHYSDGDTISLAGSSFVGTICCKLFNAFRNEYYLLTCSHVMTEDSATNYGGFLQQPRRASPVGEWTWAKLTEDIDAALIKIDPTTSFTYINGFSPKEPRVLTSNDVYTNITMIGRHDQDSSPKIVKGQIVSFKCPFPKAIQYGNGNNNIKNLNNLIILSEINNNGSSTIYKALSVAGDSGSLVYDENNIPIAMVIAGDEKQFTYAISLDLIINSTNTKIV